MRHVTATALAIALVAAGALARDEEPAQPARTIHPPEGAPQAVVLSVSAPDAVSLRVGTRTRSVRLAGVDLPPAGALRDAARDFLRRMLIAERVRVQVVSDDGRHPPRVLLFREPEGLCVNLELVRLGYARARLHKTLPGRALFAAWQRRARVAGKGIWGRSAAASQPTPATARPLAIDAPVRKRLTDDPLVYVTRSGHKYHRAGCPYLRKSRVARRLSEVVGRYEPCKRCKPPVPDEPGVAKGNPPQNKP